MILVDTSVWIKSLKDEDCSESRNLRLLLDEDEVALAAPVKVELLSGASLKDLKRLRLMLSALPCWYPTRLTWEIIDGWIEPAIKKGQRFGFADLLIAALASENNAMLWSLDVDFHHMASLDMVKIFKMYDPE